MTRFLLLFIYLIISCFSKCCDMLQHIRPNLVLSAFILAKTPSEHTQRGFFLFLGSKKNAPKMHQMSSLAHFGRFCGEIICVF